MKSKTKTVSVARLDDSLVYQGVDQIPESELTIDHIQVPADCDLKPGCYEWLKDRQTFHPTQAYLNELRAAKKSTRRA